jgi:hypothetical protein
MTEKALILERVTHMDQGSLVGTYRHPAAIGMPARRRGW